MSIQYNGFVEKSEGQKLQQKLRAETMAEISKYITLPNIYA